MAEMYVSLYLEALARLMSTHDHAAQDVMLMSLCQHADPFGWCYPGDKLIADESGHRRDTVPDILTRLELMDYIHLVYTPTPRRKAPDRDIQINPFLIALRPECHEVSIAQWLGYKSQTNGHNGNQTMVITSGKDDHQPPRTNVSNQNQELPPRITTTEPPPAPAPEPQSPTNGKRKNKTANANSSSAAGTAPQAPAIPAPQAQESGANAPTSPHPPTPLASPTPSRPLALPDVQLYKEQLSDELYERVALDMTDATGRGMSLAVARGLVMVHGTAACSAAVKLLKNKRGILNPAGHLRWIIQTGQIDAEGDARDSEDPYVSGKYADFIEH